MGSPYTWPRQNDTGPTTNRAKYLCDGSISAGRASFIVSTDGAGRASLIASTDGAGRASFVASTDGSAGFAKRLQGSAGFAKRLQLIKKIYSESKIYFPLLYINYIFHI